MQDGDIEASVNYAINDVDDFDEFDEPVREFDDDLDDYFEPVNHRPIERDPMDERDPVMPLRNIPNNIPIEIPREDNPIENRRVNNPLDLSHRIGERPELNLTQSTKAFEYNTLSIRPFICNCKNDPKRRHMIKLNDLIPDYTEPILYRSCVSNNLLSLIRLASKTVKPDPIHLRGLREYMNTLIPEIEHFTRGIRPYERQWYNHLEGPKQKEVKEFMDMFPNEITDYINRKNELNVYANMVKVEKQFIEEKKILIGDNYVTVKELPKTRCITMPKPILKFVMGPIVIEMEHLFKENFKGYKVPDNWEAQERELNQWELEGFNYTLQLDGSGFDNTQHEEIKRIIDLQIYELIEAHLPAEMYLQPNVFINTMRQSMERRVNCGSITGTERYGYIKVRGKTFSGSPDTTLMNTIRMSIYNRYVHHIANISEDDYKLWVKGDDVVCAYNSSVIRDRALASYKRVFCTKEQSELLDTYGLGQVAKFYKIGNIQDIDFCSTNVIGTSRGLKIIRKLVNIAQKQNYSVKGAYYSEEQLDAYNYDQIVSSKKWIGECETLTGYFAGIHKHNYFRAMFFKAKQALKKIVSKKERLEIYFLEPDRGYKNREKSYEEHLEDDRITETPLRDTDIFNWLHTRESISGDPNDPVDPSILEARDAWHYITEVMIMTTLGAKEKKAAEFENRMLEEVD
jgi:hypothetical protein